MKIYTKTGDTGKTSLLSGERVDKSDERIECYGTIDELNCYIGLLKELKINSKRKYFLNSIQENLFIIGSRIAAGNASEKVKASLPNMDKDSISALENHVDEMQLTLPALKNFILPGGHKDVAFAHIARVVCRRAERRLVGLESRVDEKFYIYNTYLNRLSDYLFVLSRKMSCELKVEENIWIG